MHFIISTLAVKQVPDVPVFILWQFLEVCMLAGFLLSLREGLEAALVIGMVLSVLNRLGRKDANARVWGGVALALVISAAIAVGLAWMGMEFVGLGEMMFEGTAMLLAAAVLTWLILWVHRSAANPRGVLEAQTRQALDQNAGWGLFVLAFLAVLREGVELALFLLAVEQASSPLQTLAGSLAGLACAALLGWLLFNSTRKMSLGGFFRATNILLIVFAAGMLTLGVHEFIEAGFIPALVDPLWDLSGVLSDQGQVGLLLKALVGYNAAPSLTEVLVYILYMVGIVSRLFIFKPKTAASAPATTV